MSKSSLWKVIGTVALTGVLCTSTFAEYSYASLTSGSKFLGNIIAGNGRASHLSL